MELPEYAGCCRAVDPSSISCRLRGDMTGQSGNECFQIGELREFGVFTGFSGIAIGDTIFVLSLRQYRLDRRGYASLRKTRVALWPPKPELLLMATFTG